MAEPKPENEPTIVERWLEDQQQWQRTVLAYLDAMTKNDDFLVHLGNAMRGSLLAGKPYPTAPTPAVDSSAPAGQDDRIDKVLFALRELEGQLADVQLTLEEIRGGRARSAAAPAVAALKKARAGVKKAAAKAPAARASKARTSSTERKRKGRA